MELQFSKMHGTLNDFIVFDNTRGVVNLSPDQVSFLCNRRAGIGGDGVIGIKSSDAADFFMDYMNSDGSFAEMCGNGIRCLAKYVFDNGLTTKTSVAIETRAGVKVVEICPDSDGRMIKARVNMGIPIFELKRIPANVGSNEAPLLDQTIKALDRQFVAALVSMGNPHCVILLDEDVEDLPTKYGPIIENHDLFPEKTNVEFIKAVTRNNIIMRVWERGSGETFSCGTGACASAVAAVLKGAVESPVEVDLLGGSLTIDWNGLDTPVYMTGPAVTVFSGSITL